MENILYLWAGRLNSKLAIRPHTDLEIQCNPYQNLTWHFCRKWQDDSKIQVEMQGIQNSQIILKKNKAEGLLLPEIPGKSSLTDNSA